MLFSSWLRKKAQKPTPPTRFRPRLEALDDRLVPSTLTVTNNLDTGFTGDGSLRGEIAAAQSGDTIVFAGGVSGTIVLNSDGNAAGGFELYLDKNLDIEGPGCKKLSISGAGSRVFDVAAGAHVTLSGLTIEKGSGTAGGFDPSVDDGEGGGILNFGTLTVNDCIVKNNHVAAGMPELALGGGIYNAGTLTLSHTTVTGNFGAGYGGGIYNDATGILAVSNHSSVTKNTVTISGADLYNLGTWSIDSTSKVGKVGP